MSLGTLPDLIQSEAERSNPSGQILSPHFCPLIALTLTPLNDSGYASKLVTSPNSSPALRAIDQRLFTALKVFIDDPETVAVSQRPTRK